MASVWEEMKRRKVVKVAVAYAIVAWLLVQVIVSVEVPLRLPDWADTLVIVFLLIGFVVAVFLAWAYELTPEGVERTGSAPFADKTPARPRRTLDIAIIALLALALGFVVLDNYVLQNSADVPPNSIAVLPFDNLSPNEDDAYFAAGLHEEVLNQLEKLEDLSVSSRTTVLLYQDSDLSTPEIAAELNVGTIMEGSVRYADDRVRITLQLIDAETDQHLWSETYDQEFEDIFAIESNIAMNVADAMEAEFSLEEQENVARAPTESTEALKLYMQGRYFWNFRTEEAIEMALGYFQDAIGLDSDYAKAYSGIADVWLSRGWYSVLAPRDTFPNAIAATEMALRLDDTLVQAQATRAHIYLEFDHDWDVAEEGYLRAIALDPSYPSAHQWYGGYLSAMERHEQALEQALIARDLAPFSSIINTWVGLRYYFAGDYASAIEEIQKALVLRAGFAPGHWHLGWALEQDGQYEAAIASAQRALMIDDSPIHLASLGHAHAKAGNDSEARQILEQLRQISATRHVSAYHTAVIYVALDDIDEGFEMVGRCVPGAISVDRLYACGPETRSASCGCQVRRVIGASGSEEMSDKTLVGSVAGIWRFPVKSMKGEQLEHGRVHRAGPRRRPRLCADRR